MNLVALGKNREFRIKSLVSAENQLSCHNRIECDSFQF